MPEGLGSSGFLTCRGTGSSGHSPSFLGGVNDPKPVKNVSSLYRKDKSSVNKKV